MKTNYKKAFTLVELLVVISIITFLSSLVMASVSSAKIKANDAIIAQDVRQVQTATELYYTDKRSYPTTTISNDPCEKFNEVAQTLVNGKYLSKAPVHPNNDTTNGVCYKANSTDSYFTVYGPLAGKLSDGYNKKTGFILTTDGSSVDSKLAIVYADTGYPYSVTNSGGPTTVSSVSDSIRNVTTGSTVTYGGSTNYTDPTPKTYNYTASVQPVGSGTFTSYAEPGNLSNNSPIPGTPYPYPSGTIVHLAAYPTNSHYVFSYWINCSSPYMNTCIEPVGTSDKTVTAVFNLLP